MNKASDLPGASRYWLLGSIAITIAPHAEHFPAWLLGLCASLVLAQAAMVRRGHPPPHRLVLALVALVASVGVKLQFDHFFGKDPGVALLAVLLSIKQLESRAPRDVHAAVLLSYFLQMSLFLYDQTPLVGLLVIVGTLASTVTLLSLQAPREPALAQLRTGAVLLAQGLPFMLVLFLLFPRVQGPLWGLPNDAYSGTTGLSDTMAPGSIAELSQSDAIAFRAAFRERTPPPAQRYWRGPVLTLFDGRTWRQASSPILAAPPYRPSGPAYDYRLTLEPHNQNWLLALEHPGAGIDGARYTADLRLLATEAVRQRAGFDLRAYPETQPGLTEDARVLALARQLPDGFNPRTRALAQKLARRAASDQAIVDASVTYLRDASLVYTLTPPVLGVHTVDEFLFDTHRGFCEHFASAFVFLMRAADVPARVVTGYQGGEINPVDGTLVVRQSDAHAWAEVWLRGRGWVRVDPTALAAPRRLESGIADALSDLDGLPLLMRPELSWLRNVRHRWDALSNTWNQWVLGYNPDRQREFLANIGVGQPDWKAYGGLLGASAGALMLLLFAWAYLQRPSRDALDRAWANFCRKLAKHGVSRHPWEGPKDYGLRAARARPANAAELQEIADVYARLRYGARHDASATRDLAKRIRRLKLK
ncbi:MAG TPA: DUF3488 and transglutaminase-like domain-containing protein [Aromatoleum sp.]|uniref:transglutaminase TgpA family protein n=1 Tax=Aromatoleum sp. TaxID=2307007 RepID=UPI002B4618E7|nr:DUF3488 and transglutaminase-like domain-containing protein [Aromatoleum sp.]HJV25018.1 DUF3488 and transglutaminase-like domain-containing protein [Aromatoleum sp.]